MRGCSLFTGAGIAETFLDDLGLNIVVANELKKERANLYSSVHKKTKMVCGDIQDKKIFEKIIKDSGKINFLLASPPCQGMSIAGKNRTLKDMRKDERNHLIKQVIKFIKIKNPDYAMIENVPSVLKLEIEQGKKMFNVVDLLKFHFGKNYDVEAKVLDSSDYGTPQVRKRAIIKVYKKGLKWEWPKKEKKITVKDAIGHLPSLESGEKSKILWHFARTHLDRHKLWMKNTPTGKTAFENKKHFPKKEDGTKIKGYMSTYRRIKWNQPSPTITIRNDAISSQRNVHPGRKNKDGTYSDSRVLTPLELMLLSSLPKNWKIPKETPEILIRQCIGECIPPIMVKKIIEPIFQNEK